jgi:hypothetical protein
MSYQDEAQSGGLIDRYWIFLHWIVIPLISIASLFGIIYLIGHSCPYIEDVSSCFPYNLPNWAMIVLPLGLIIILIVVLLLVARSVKNEK